MEGEGMAKKLSAVDRYNSIYVRLRDTNEHGYGLCFTCKNPVHYRSAQAGHYIGRGNMQVRLMEENVNIQCVKCNEHKHGNLDNYEQALKEKYGEEVLDKIHKEAKKSEKMMSHELKEKEEDLRGKCVLLLLEKSFNLEL